MIAKTAIVERIIAQLQDALDTAIQASHIAHETATHEESVAENKYDTFGLEASYLAEGLSRQVQTLKDAIQMYRNGRFADLPGQDIRVGSFIVLETDDELARYYFLGPAGGGIEVMVDGIRCQVVTPGSPLGQAMLGKSVDDEVRLLLGGNSQQLTVTHTF